MKRTDYQHAPNYVERDVGAKADPEFATPGLPVQFEGRAYLPASEYWLTQHLCFGRDEQVIKHTGLILMRVGECGMVMEMTPAMLREQAEGFIAVAEAIEKRADAAAAAALERAEGAGK